MNKTILMYRWNSNSEAPFAAAMEKLGLQVISFEKPIRDYHADAAFAREFLERLHTCKPDAVFSFDYFPILSSLCEINGLPYLSWIYDCPQYTLCSRTLGSRANYIFCFDRVYTQRLQQAGAVNCVHFPLGVLPENFERVIGTASPQMLKQYRSPISFVGNFYNGEQNRFRQADLGEYARGCAEGLIEAQRRVYGYNFLEEAIPEAVSREIAEKCRLTTGELYVCNLRQMSADTLGMEVSARERERVLEIAAQCADTAVYTGSRLPETLAGSPNLSNRGYADNASQMPLIFHESGINLNITSKTIVSGIPQRILDILACGGFCVSNYQPEAAEYFSDGEELVFYSGEEELREKLLYYLEREEERKRIAQRGLEKVKKQFSLEKKIPEMLRIAGLEELV